MTEKSLVERAREYASLKPHELLNIDGMEIKELASQRGWL